MNEWTGQNTERFAVMSRQAARAFDAYAMDVLKIPGVVLMENAGRGAAEVIGGLFGSIRRAAVFCGGGNNGGDGFVIARHLFNRGTSVQVVLCADPARLKGDALVNYTICRQMQIPLSRLEVEKPRLLETVRTLTAGCDVIVDALFGTGLKGELAEPFIRLICGLNAQKLPMVSVDIPSGLDCDTGLPLPISIEAVATVTFAGLKQGFVQTPDSRCATGRVYVASIGADPATEVQTQRA